MTRIVMTEPREHVTGRPRRCGCGIPVVVTVDDLVLDDRPSKRGLPHTDCYFEVVDLGAGDA